MSTYDTKIVLFDSDEAATYQTNISGWVSGKGYFTGNDERAARYDGCTHIRCKDCGEPTAKGRLVCSKCSEIRDVNRHANRAKQEWDGVGMLYSESADRYFHDWDDVNHFLENEGGTMEGLRLIICEPSYLTLLSVDNWADEYPEDTEMPEEVMQAIEVFNTILRRQPPVSWYPGSKAVIIPKSEVS